MKGKHKNVTKHIGARYVDWFAGRILLPRGEEAAETPRGRKISLLSAHPSKWRRSTSPHHDMTKREAFDRFLLIGCARYECVKQISCSNIATVRSSALACSNS